MKLFLNDTSPFARFVRATALELGLENRLELVWADPWSDQADLVAVNPLSRVPALVDDDGVAITESLLIARRLTSIAPQDGAFADGSARMLSELGLAYGIMDLAFALTIHKRFFSETTSAFQQRRQASLARALAAAEAAVRDPAPWTLPRCCLWIALDYIIFRQVMPLEPSVYPGLTAFMKAHENRPALVQTAFTA
ncbi:hypothetical protein GCM10007276_31320 [Agaricicola taiwanensis]|uniref:GST N-terminal domain-containing protein n=1 Tax=Agaricicola taiwanensis TaxID=591372 RepID=A0A8J3DZQ7_9RHOB|nr:glutathione S-transferase N-terminal domain-containing protein [Agaricicola taiwanensis]GGE51983.1 hypothetical protein GCM10007276_31320 [Agaricicola taiwanensis]